MTNFTLLKILLTNWQVHFFDIELNEICDLDSQICDPVQLSKSILTPVLLPNLRNILESVLISIPVVLELESPILESHIPSWGNECGLEIHLLDLDPLPEPISTPKPLPLIEVIFPSLSICFMHTNITMH